MRDARDKIAAHRCRATGLKNYDRSPGACVLLLFDSAAGTTRMTRARMRALASPPLPDIDKPAGDCCRRRHDRRDEMRAPAKTLAAFEIAVRGRGAALARRELVGIHCKAHRAAGLAPIETGAFKNLVEPFGFGLHLYQARARHDHRVDAVMHVPAFDDLCGGAQILDAAVGA